MLPGIEYEVKQITRANDGNPLIFIKEKTNEKLQFDNGNTEVQGSDINRNTEKKWNNTSQKRE